jgi:putative hemin transport protein
MKTATAPNTETAASAGSRLDPNELSQRWNALLEKEPKLRIRNCADKLNVSELQLLATRCGEGVTRLAGDWQALLKRVPELGHVMALTRNDAMVHERHGLYREINFFGPVMGQVVGPDIDLRLFMSHWHHGFAVEEESRDGVRRSLQFFDQDGSAVHKIYLQEDSNLEAFKSILAEFLADDQSCEVTVHPLQPDEPERPDSEIDVEAFRQGWREMQDTHEFFGLLKKHKVARTQALRLIGAEFARPVANDSLESVLRAASERQAEIMVFVGSPGCIQIHTGPVDRIVPFEEWINVLDPEFNLHAKVELIATSWVVRKPTKDGIVTALELFDAQGRNLALLFGKRKPGSPEREDWREIVANLSDAPAESGKEGA